VSEWLAEGVLNAAQFSAVHLEMRDSYMLDGDDFVAWRNNAFDPVKHLGWWLDLVRATVGRGVVMRRARIVSEPVHQYIKFEYEVTVHNVEAGEEVRWLPRRRAVDLALPGGDFWLIDQRIVVFNHFDGTGHWADPPEEVRDDPDVARLCATAFEAVWARATPHAEYDPA
jgi:hypothetical protein